MQFFCTATACDSELTKTLPDSAWTASSILDSNNLPHFARLHDQGKTGGTGKWTPLIDYTVPIWIMVCCFFLISNENSIWICGSHGCMTGLLPRVIINLVPIMHSTLTLCPLQWRMNFLSESLGYQADFNV